MLDKFLYYSFKSYRIIRKSLNYLFYVISKFNIYDYVITNIFIYSFNFKNYYLEKLII